MNFRYLVIACMLFPVFSSYVQASTVKNAAVESMIANLNKASKGSQKNALLKLLEFYFDDTAKINIDMQGVETDMAGAPLKASMTKSEYLKSKAESMAKATPYIFTSSLLDVKHGSGEGLVIFMTHTHEEGKVMYPAGPRFVKVTYLADYTCTNEAKVNANVLKILKSDCTATSQLIINDPNYFNSVQ